MSCLISPRDEDFYNPYEEIDPLDYLEPLDLMKTRPTDEISVRDGKLTLSIFTDRSRLVITAENDSKNILHRSLTVAQVIALLSDRK